MVTQVEEESIRTEDEEEDAGSEYERHVAVGDDLGMIRVAEDEKSGYCMLTFWEGTTIHGPKNQYAKELDAFCCDFEYLLNNKSKMYLIEYDQWSFSDPVIEFVQATLEPIVNCIFKKKKVSIQLLDNTQQLQLCVHQ